MNRNQGYQDEIDLMKLFFYCVKRWRWIVLSMVVFAVIAGGYKYLSTAKSNQYKQQAMEQSEETEKVENGVIVNPNVGYYELAIEKGQQNVELLKDFVENSVIMELNPEHVQTGTVSFYIQPADGENGTVEALASSFQSYVTDGRLAEKLFQAGNELSLADIQYLLKYSDGTEQKVSSNTTILLGSDNEKSPETFQIQVMTPTSKLCETYVGIIRNEIVAYSDILQKELAPHELKVLSVSQSECINRELREYQKEMSTAYVDAIKQVQTLQTELETVRTNEGETITVGAEITLENPVTAAGKFAAIGLLLGAFLSVFVLALFYIMSGKLQSVDTFEQEYSMKLLGQVTEQPEKRAFSFVDQWLNRLAEGAYAAIPYEEQMKIVSSNVMAELGKHEAVRKVMLAGTVAEKDVQGFCSHMKEAVKDVVFSEYKQVVFSAAALEEMENYDAVLFLEKKGVSDKNMIYQEKELADRRDTLVLGTVVL